jgi:ubiquinone/menaquinone biosynthesis C-methylase UbiE
VDRAAGHGRLENSIDSMTQQPAAPQAAYRGRTKYDDRAAQRYQVRKEGKHRAELRLVDRAFTLIPKNHRVLDVPCGGGRVTLHLARKGYSMTCADLSDGMLKIARENVARHGFQCAVEKQDIERLSYGDQAFDSVISFRLFHHFPNSEIRQRAVTELCRVARQYVALSYFSPASVTSVKRKIRAALGGRRSDKHTTPLGEVQEYFGVAGFRLVKDFAQLPLVHTLHLAVFERAQDARKQS